MSDSLTSSIEPESKQSALSERELLDLYENPDLFKSIVGGDAFNAIEEIEPEYVNKFIVSNYLSESQNIDSVQILENYESYSKSLGLTGISANDANDIVSDIRRTQNLSLQEIKPVTFKEGVSGAAQRGIQNLSQAYSLMGISDPTYQSLIDGKISEINQLDKVLESGLSAGAKERARRQQESAKQFVAGTLLLKSNEIKNFIDAQSKIESAKLSEGYKSFVDSGNIPTSPKAFAEFLVGFMTEQSVQQAPTALKTMMSGFAGSPTVVATVFSESFHQERAFEMLQHLRENGVNFDDQESLNAALSNDELMSDAMLRGMNKSLPIAITSALSAYLPIKGKTVFGKLGKEVVTQAGLDSVGEVLGQSFATGEVDMQEVMLEVLGGTTQSVAEFTAKVGTNIAKSPINDILKNEDGSIKSRKEVAALSEYLPDDFAEEISEVDPVTGNLVVEATRGNSEAYDSLVSVIRSVEEVEVEVSPELKKLSDAVNELESITTEIQTEFEFTEEDVRDARLEEFKEREIVKGRPAPVTTQEKIDNLKERQEQSRRKAKDAAKERFSKMESRYKERVAKLQEEAKDLKVKNKQAWVDERADVKELSKQIQEFLNVLPPASRGKVKFVRKMANATTVDSRLKVLQGVVDRVNSLIDEDFTKGRKALLRTVVKKATKGDAKAVSKRLGPNAEIVQKIDRIMKSSAEDNQAAMLEELSQLPEDSEEGRAVSTLYDAFSNINAKEPKELNASIALVEAIIQDGKDFRKRFKAKSEKEIQDVADNLLEEMQVVDPTKPIKALPAKGERKVDALMPDSEIQAKEELKGVWDRMLDGADFYLSKHDGIEQLIENLLRVPGTQYKGKTHEALTKESFVASEKFQTRQRQMRESAFDVFSSVLKKAGSSIQEIKELFTNLRKTPNFKKGETTGVYFESQPGFGVREQPISKDQGIQLWMWRQDKTLQGSFDTMQWDEQVDSQLESYIGEEGMALGKHILKMYKSLGLEMNDVLFEVEGWKLPLIENYSPVSKHAKDAKVDIDEAMKGGVVRATEKNNSMKLRLDEKAALDFSLGAIGTLDRHLTEMNHYITHGKAIHRMRNVFNKKSVQSAIRQLYGKNRIKVINRMIDNFTRGTIDYSKQDGFVSALIRNVAVGKLSLNLPSATKQLGSIPAYANSMPASEFAAGLGSFLRHPIDKIKILLETDYIKNRLSTTGDRDLRALAENKSFQQAAMKSRNWRDRLMILTRLGDVGAIMAGGWPIYKKTYDQAIADGKSISEAKKAAELEFAFISDRSQQSSKIQNLSWFQTGGSFAKLFTMFMTSPIQYTRITASAIKAAAKGRIRKRDALKTFAIYHVILPQIFTAMGSMGIGIFSDDEEKQEAWLRRQAWALAMGNLNSLFVLGDGIDAILGGMIKGESFFDLSNPVSSELSKISKGLSKLGTGELDTFEEQSDLVGGMLLLFGGIPYDTISREFEAKYELLQGDDVYQNIWGISDYSAFEAKKKKKKKKSTSSYYFD